MPDSGSQPSGSSVSAFLSAFIPGLVVFVIFVIIFALLKRKYRRVYEPRASVDTVPAALRADKQPNSVWGWLPFILKKPAPYTIAQTGVDGYFFLRYLSLFIIIGLLGGIVLWPVLFAVNATGGGSTTGFDVISMSHNTKRWASLAHVFCSWFFFGTVLWIIYRELVFYTSFRHALETSPLYSSLPYSRILLIDNVPKELLDETELNKLFPAAEKTFFPQNTKELRKLIKKRTKLANKLEGGINKTILKCNKLRLKAIKKGTELPAPEEEPASYFKPGKLPSYKDKPIIGKKKYLLTDGFDELAEYNTKIADMQATYPDKDKIQGSVFLQFPNSMELQRAYQAVPYCKDLKLCRRYSGFAPEDVVWENMADKFVVRHGKYIAAASLLTATIIFWSIPVAVVGAISNINFLMRIVPFLRFLHKMPSKLMGIITGLLPTIALAVLMSLLPPYIRKLGKIAGCLTVQQVERWTQQWFFAFQIVQVFLVTTLGSAAASVVPQIIHDPSSAMSMLAYYLPRASNFYIPYMVLQGLSISSGLLAQIVTLALSFVLGPILDKTPRKKWNRYNNLSSPDWGTTYALYGLFVALLLVYGIIAPLIIAFAVITMSLVYVAFLYNLSYVSSHSYDSRGRNYPLALFEVFVGLYFGEICLLGLFVVSKNWAAVVLEVVPLALTVACHLYYRWTFEPLFEAVPMGAYREVDMGQANAYPMNDQGRKQIKEEGQNFFQDNDSGNFVVGDENSSTTYKEKAAQPLEGNSSAVDAHTYNDGNDINDVEKAGAAGGKHLDLSKAHAKQSLLNYFKPRTSLSFEVARSMLPARWLERCDKDLADNVDYSNPEIIEEPPKIWIPKDQMGMSQKLIADADGKFFLSDDNAVVSEKGKAEYTGLPPDYEPELAY